MTNEIPTSIVDFMEFYLLNYFKPGSGSPDRRPALAGRAVFTQIGCATCHIPTFTINHDRRVADVDTVFDPAQGNPINRLFATATVKVVNGLAGVDDGTGLPTLKLPAGQSFVVNNFFADFKRHRPRPQLRRAELRGDVRDLVHDRAALGRRNHRPLRA